MRHLIVFVVLVGIAHCDVVHLQHYPAVPVVQYHQPYHQPYVPVHNAYYSAPLRSAVVNPYVGAYHAVPAYSRQVFGNPQYFAQLRAPVQTSGQYVNQQQPAYRQQESQKSADLRVVENPPDAQQDKAAALNQARDNSTVKTKKYEIRRPAIRKEFYDIEEKVIVRPAGSALIELDPPYSKTEKKEDLKNDAQPNSDQQSYDQPDSGPPNSDQIANYAFSRPQQPVPEVRPVYIPQHPPYGFPAGPHQGYPLGPPLPVPVPGDVPDCAYQPPAPTPPPNTYLPPRRTPPNTQPPSVPYHPTTFQPPTSPGHHLHPHPHHHNLIISSSTPVNIVEEYVPDSEESSQVNPQNENTKSDIVYSQPGADETDSTFEAENADEFLHEVPHPAPHGDTSGKYREQNDQFYHELPRARYQLPNQSPFLNVETRSHGSPTIYSADLQVDPNQKGDQSANNTKGNDKQKQLIDLYIGNGGVTEVASITPVTPSPPKTSAAYTASNDSTSSPSPSNSSSTDFTNIDGVRARVISVTPAPDHAVPQESSKTRRVVISKHVTTVQEIEEPENSNDTIHFSRDNNTNTNQGGSSAPGHFITQDQDPSSTPASASTPQTSGQLRQSSSTPDCDEQGNPLSSSTPRSGQYNLPNDNSGYYSSTPQYYPDAPNNQRSGQYNLPNDYSGHNSPNQYSSTPQYYPDSPSSEKSGRYSSPSANSGYNAPNKYSVTIQLSPDASNSEKSGRYSSPSANSDYNAPNQYPATVQYAQGAPQNEKFGRYSSPSGSSGYNAPNQYSNTPQYSPDAPNSEKSGRYSSPSGSSGYNAPNQYPATVQYSPDAPNSEKSGRYYSPQAPASRRVTFVRPVSQEFAQLRASPPSPSPPCD